MERPGVSRTDSDHLTETERQQLGDALSVLARMLTKVVLRERSLLERAQHREFRDSAVRTYQVATVRGNDQPLTLSVGAAAKILGLSKASAYTAIHTGQIPSIRFGSRILVPRVALERMISEADNPSPDDR